MLSIGLNTFMLSLDKRSKGNHRVQVGSSQSGTIRRLGEFVVSCLAYVLHKFDLGTTWSKSFSYLFHIVLSFLKCNEMTPQLLGDSKILKDAIEDGAMATILSVSRSPTGYRNIRYETKKIKIKVQLIDSYSCQCKTKTSEQQYMMFETTNNHTL